ncbi:hypothetical protein WA026_016845 [Henosepilachna vigintioctopunctata]|uniref:Uncharacterized protein n=1 Tax=Henosepilachna vigintioctopunctata TaxID=420089 RepID=A0AAW1UAN6_9CUCU
MVSGILVDNFNYCECCGLETIRQLRITKARTLSNLFPKNQTAPAASQNSFDDFQVENEQLTLIEDSLITDDVSSDNEKKQLLSVSSDFFSLEKSRKKTYQMASRPPKKPKYSSRSNEISHLSKKPPSHSATTLISMQRKKVNRMEDFQSQRVVALAAPRWCNGETANYLAGNISRY